MQSHCTSLDVYTDSDWAVCRKTCKSTSGGAIMLGGHYLNIWSGTQAIILKSPAEAELYGVVRGATEALGMCTLIRDLGGEDLQIELHLDATATKGIIERRGLSKVRHGRQRVMASRNMREKGHPVEQGPRRGELCGSHD